MGLVGTLKRSAHCEGSNEGSENKCLRIPSPLAFLSVENAETWMGKLLHQLIGGLPSIVLRVPSWCKKSCASTAWAPFCVQVSHTSA